MKNVLTISCAMLALAGCASRASSVAPVSISASDYQSLSCDDAKAKLEVARAQENALTRKQNNAAAADAASVFLVLLPLGSVFGSDVSGELAQAKGEVLALERAVPARCSQAATPATATAAPAPVVAAPETPAPALIAASAPTAAAPEAAPAAIVAANTASTPAIEPKAAPAQ